MQNPIKIITAIVLVAACSVRADGQTRRPAPSGDYGVGRRNEIWTDSARGDPVDSTELRRVSVFIWYPTNVRSRTASDPVLPDEWQTLRLQGLEIRFGAEMGGAMREFRSFAKSSAPVAHGSVRFPVLIFTPGLGWLASDYSVIVEDLVSHGYIVVGFSPEGFSDPVMFPDGRVVKRSLGVGEKIGTDQAYVHQDALFVLEEIRKRMKTGFLEDRADLNRIGAFGHSLGGTTSLVLASRDTSVRGAVNIDGDPMGNVREVRPTQPILLISSQVPRMEDAPDMPAERRMLVEQGMERSEKRRTGEWDSIASRSASARRVRILGTQHLNFTDAALVSDRLKSKDQRWMKFGGMEPDRALTITSEVVRSFFDQLFGRKSTAFLTALQHRFPELTAE
jgi:dienelactone hydrolase